MDKKLLIVGAIAVALLGGLYFVFKPQPATTPGDSPPNPAQEPTAGVPLRQEFILLVQKGKLAAGPEKMTVPQGTEVTIRVHTDVADELHLHGYDRKVPISAGDPGVLTFLADRAGRFELELHKAHAELAVLEVQPG